jgi:hypothetical protein
MVIKETHLKSCQGEPVEPVQFPTEARLRQAQADIALFMANFLLNYADTKQ